MSKNGRRIVICCALLTGGLASGACRSATQAELDISTTAQCSEIGSVALVVSGDPESAESRVQQGFYAAQTTDCDVNRWIGSLVVTPGDDRAAVIIIAPPSGSSISQCQPPKYAGCIVARRAFSFISHVGLKIPVSLDVECKDVPCDAFSTCRKGACYSSETTCDDTGTCLGSGELPDGGLSLDASVDIDGSPPRDGAAGDASVPTDGSADAADADADADVADALVDSGTDTGTIKSAPAGVTCAGTILTCVASVCSSVAPGAQACCVGGSSALPMCGVPSDPQCADPAEHYCCSDANCGGFSGVPVPAPPKLVSTPFCVGVSGAKPGTCSNIAP